MKFTYLPLILILLFSSCTQKKQEPDVSPLLKSEISGESLWARISEEADYKSYSFFTDHEGEQQGQAPHGPFHRIYVNKTLLGALPIANGVVPDGSIIVKDNLSAAKEMTGITVMAKIEGYDAENSDWFWAMYSPEGEVRAAGKLDGCIGCHEGMKDNDYVIVKRLNTP